MRPVRYNGPLRVAREPASSSFFKSMAASLSPPLTAAKSREPSGRSAPLVVRGTSEGPMVPSPTGGLAWAVQK